MSEFTFKYICGLAATIIRVFEHYCKTGFVAPTFTRWFSESKKSDPAQVKRDVAQAIVKVIGTVHLFIQVILLVIRRLDLVYLLL